MNSEDTLNTHTVSDHTGATSGDTGLPDYDAEGLAIKDEGAKEGKIFPGTDDEYPLRDASEDPKWAVRVCVIWAGIAIFCIVFILVMMILGIWYD